MRYSFVALVAVAGLIACTDSASNKAPSSSPTSDGGAPHDGGESSGEVVVAFDACTMLSQTEAQGIMAYDLTPCRKEPVTDAVRHIWESPSSAPIEATGSVNVTVEQKGKSFEDATVLCGADGADCIPLDGIGEKAVLQLKFTWVAVKKGDAVFEAQCEKPGKVMEDEGITIDEKLNSETKKPDLTIRTEESDWRNAAACSLAIAKLITGKLP